MEDIVDQYLKTVFNFVYQLVRDRSLAEDITQEVFIKVWQNLKRYDESQSFRAWIFTIARHTAIDWLRKKRPINFSQLKFDEDSADFADTIADDTPLPDELFYSVERSWPEN